MPEHHFEDDYEDLLRVYRSREMQFVEFLGDIATEKSPFTKLDSKLTMRENLVDLSIKGKQNTFFDGYKVHLKQKQELFEQQVKIILSNQWYTISLRVFFTLCILFVAWLLYNLSKMFIEDKQGLHETLWLLAGMSQFITFNLICYFLQPINENLYPIISFAGLCITACCLLSV